MFEISRINAKLIFVNLGPLPSSKCLAFLFILSIAPISYTDGSSASANGGQFENTTNIANNSWGHNDEESPSGGTNTEESPQTSRSFFQSILASQDAATRPVRDPSESVNVTLRIALYQILEVNEKEQYVKLYVGCEEEWNNELLVWDPAAYDNITELIFAKHDIWEPNTYLYNKIDETIPDTAVRATMDHKNPGRSKIANYFPAIYKISCHIHSVMFPYDLQTCKLVFGSVVDDKTTVDYHHTDSHMLTDHYVPHSEWTLVDVSTERLETKYQCCKNDYYAVLQFNIVIQRKPMYNIVNFIYPTLAITLMTLLGFYTPSYASGNREEKVSIGLASLIVMSFFLLMVASGMPKSSDYIPVINFYFVALILLIAIGTVISSHIIGSQQMARFATGMIKPVATDAKLRKKIKKQVGNFLSPKEIRSKRRQKMTLGSTAGREEIEIHPLGNSHANPTTSRSRAEYAVDDCCNQETIEAFSKKIGEILVEVQLARLRSEDKLDLQNRKRLKVLITEQKTNFRERLALVTLFILLIILVLAIYLFIHTHK